MQEYPKNPWWTMISSIGKEGMDLARALLRYDPVTRPSAKEVSRRQKWCLTSRLSISASSPSTLDQHRRSTSQSHLQSFALASSLLMRPKGSPNYMMVP